VVHELIDDMSMMGVITDELDCAGWREAEDKIERLLEDKPTAIVRVLIKGKLAGYVNDV
jgi:hypothetical protein